jgi:hypothetical protein
MPKRHQQRPAKEIHGRNSPEKSMEITTGTYKKKETYQEQAYEHENPAKLSHSCGNDYKESKFANYDAREEAS